MAGEFRGVVDSSISPPELQFLSGNRMSRLQLIVTLVSLCLSIAACYINDDIDARPVLTSEEGQLPPSKEVSNHLWKSDGSALSAAEWNETCSVFNIIHNLIDTDTTRDILHESEIEEFIHTVPELEKEVITMRALNDKVIAPFTQRLRDAALRRDIPLDLVCHSPNFHSNRGAIILWLPVRASIAHQSHHNDKQGKECALEEML